MTKFKYLDETEDNPSLENQHLKEIAYQLKRIADKLEVKNDNIRNN